jgi:hypothetical protein
MIKTDRAHHEKFFALLPDLSDLIEESKKTVRPFGENAFTAQEFSRAGAYTPQKAGALLQKLILLNKVEKLGRVSSNGTHMTWYRRIGGKS